MKNISFALTPLYSLPTKQHVFQRDRYRKAVWYCKPVSHGAHQLRLDQACAHMTIPAMHCTVCVNGQFYDGI